MIVKNGATDVTTYFVLRDSTNHAPKTDVTVTDIDLYYVEQGAAISAKADATALAAADSAHADNKAFHCGQGLYRIDWPDAAFDGGIGKKVYLLVVCTGVDTTFLEIELSPPTDAVALSGSATAADNCELMFDGTGYAGGTTKLNVNTSTITNDAITAAAIAAGAIDAATFAADVDAEARSWLGLATNNLDTQLSQSRAKYANGAVWIGPATNTNTTSYTDGIITNPVSTIAAAKTIADALGLRRFEVIRTGTVQVNATLAGYRLSGVGWSLTTTGGSQDVGTTAFLGASVVGGTFASTTGTINWEQCEFATGVTVGVSNMVECRFQGTLTLSTAGNYDFIDCVSVVAGTGTPVFAMPAGTINVSFRRWSGGIRITGITSGTTISIDAVSGGTVTLEGADGNVQVRGMVAGITDSRTGTPTLGQNAAINITKINTEIDTALSDYDPPTNAEMEARTLVAANYATAANQTTIIGYVDCLPASWVTVPTTAEIKTAMEAAGGHLALILDDTGTSGVAVASGSKTGYTLAAAGLDSVVVETGLNGRQALSIIAAGVAGVLAGAATTSVTIAAAGVPATNRISATVDSSGNRTAVTLSAPT